MSTIKFILKDLGVMKLWSVWTRRYIVSTVVKRCIRDRGFREVILRFKHTILRQRKTLMIAASAAYKNNSDQPPSCEHGISDSEMQALVSELENVQNLAKMTLYCTSCGKRLVIDKKQAGVRYCVCKDPKPMGDSEGWVPYMETEDVIIWRKEYKPGKGLYAYKVYGRYPEVQAKDFAAVQIDGAYRKAWDAAVAALAVVQTNVRGVPGQAVLHWEVLWPRLFANRDYVYIRRHKEYEIKTTVPAPVIQEKPTYETKENVHSKAKRKSIESYAREGDRQISNKVYIIVNKSCVHPDVPETRNAIRVSEYWSHMVVKTVHGTEKPGMEFVLTYYDEPAVGGMPGGVTAWVSSRGAPQYLEQMRRAANDYRAWAKDRTAQELPDFVPFGPDQVYNELALQIQEQDMESSKQGPELDNGVPTRDQSVQTEVFLLQSYMTEIKKVVPDDNGNSKEPNHEENNVEKKNEDGESKIEVSDESNNSQNGNGNSEGDKLKESEKVVKESEKIEKEDEKVAKESEKVKESDKEMEQKDDEKSGAVNGKTSNGDVKESKPTSEEEREDESEKLPVEEENNGGWWRYLYPFYYFV